MPLVLEIADAGSPPFSVVITGDAVTKASRYANCARGTKQLAPVLQTHYKQPNTIVESRHASGTLSLAALKAQGQPFQEQQHQHADDDADAQEEEECSTVLHCARPKAYEAGAVDVYGVVGFVCSHGVPVRGAFADMRTPEQYAYYIIILMWLLMLCTSIKDVYVDFACKLKVSWKAYLDANKDDLGEHEHIRQVRLMVGWMHGASHVLSCQLKNCGKFIPDTARSIGEQAESLWSMLKVGLTSRCITITFEVAHDLL